MRRRVEHVVDTPLVEVVHGLAGQLVGHDDGVLQGSLVAGLDGPDVGGLLALVAAGQGQSRHLHVCSTISLKKAKNVIRKYKLTKAFVDSRSGTF